MLKLPYFNKYWKKKQEKIFKLFVFLCLCKLGLTTIFHFF